VDEDLICEIDQEPFLEPVATPCLHTFCAKCIQQWVEAHHTCPNCRSTIQLNQLKRNVTVNKIVEKLSVNCVLKSVGCEWNGIRGSIESHLIEKCEYVPINCKFCDIELPRGQLQDHQKNSCEKRLILCSCEKIIPFCEHSKHLEFECENREDNCPACYQQMKIFELLKHSEQCSMVVIPCPIPMCGAQMERQNMKKHMAETMAEHILMTATSLQKRVLELEQNLEEKKKEIEILKEKIDIKSSGCFQFIIPQKLIGIRPTEEFFGQSWTVVNIKRFTQPNSTCCILSVTMTGARIVKAVSLANIRLNIRPAGSKQFASTSLSESLILTEIGKFHVTSRQVITALNVAEQSFEYECSIAMDDNTPLHQFANITVSVYLDAYQV